MARRLLWANFLLNLAYAAAWFFRNVVGIVICNSILPRSEGKAFEGGGGRVGEFPGRLEDVKNLDGDRLRK